MTDALSVVIQKGTVEEITRNTFQYQYKELPNDFPIATVPSTARTDHSKFRQTSLYNK